MTVGRPATPKEGDMKNNRIAEFRNRARLTQAELGKLMDLDHTTISRHESGDRNLTPDDITKYAKVFKVDTWELFMSPEEIAVST